MRALRLLRVLLCAAVAGAGLLTAQPLPPERAAVIRAAEGLLGITEATGRNDGPEIERMLAFAGASKGDPYCAAFVAWVYHMAGLDGIVPRSAWSPDMLRQPTWTARAGGTAPRPGDTFGIYFPRKGRIAHTGLVRTWPRLGSTFTTLEANTSPESAEGERDRDGDGIWSKRRLKRQAWAVRAWLK
ncbi:MAG: CHAP domain-containing protein [Verrucomicrobia bacterium]|nr:CHAP domain-containing protein [Verrucomicrobiota bacterium]